MATSSLYKEFYITDKKEASALVNMLYDSVQNPPNKREKMPTLTFTKEEWDRLVRNTIHARK